VNIAGKIPTKKSRKDMTRQLNALIEEVNRSRKMAVNAQNLLFFMTVRLYELKPDEEIFTSGFLNEDFLKKVKNAVAKRAEEAKKSGGVDQSPTGTTEKLEGTSEKTD